MSKLDAFARYMANHRLHRIIDNIRTGWAQFSFIFYIGSVSAILGAYFGLAGFGSSIFTIAFFYYAGKFHKRVEYHSRKPL